MPPDDALPVLLGGEPIRPQGPPAWPIPDEAVWEALQAAYRDGSWGRYHGGNVARLEQRLAADWGVAHALTCGSGTFAIELALRALRVEAGDEVVMAAYDYGGNFLCVHAVGARPVLVDVNADNWNLAPEVLEAAITSSTRAILVSHLHGGLVPMREVVAIAARHGVAVIEDAAQVPGAWVQGKKAGTWGDVSVLSFGGSKLLTAGRGGALLTSQATVFQRARTWLQRGNHICPLSELQATVLLPQLDRLVERNERRAQSVAELKQLLRDVPGLRLFRNRDDQENQPAYYKLGFQFEADRFGLSRERFIAALRAEGIAFDDGFRALHVGRSPNRWRSPGSLTNAERAHHGTVVLHHPVLLEGDAAVRQVAQSVRKVHAHAERLR